MPLPFGGFFLSLILQKAASRAIDRVFPMRPVAPDRQVRTGAAPADPPMERSFVMSTRWNKAVVATLAAIVAIISAATGADLSGVPLEWLATLISPILVYLVPNRN